MNVNIGYNKITWKSYCQPIEGMLGCLVPRNTVCINELRKGR